MSFLRDLALAHASHEGYFAPGENKNYPKGTLSWRNHNPGNLRLTVYQQAKFGATQGQGGFAAFPTFDDGLAALEDDVGAKIMGTSPRVAAYLANHGKKYLEATFLDYVSVYAPTADGNSPIGYTKALCARLNLIGYNLTPDTPLLELAALINPPFEPVANVKRRLQREIEAEQNPIRKARLQKRLDAFISSHPTT